MITVRKATRDDYQPIADMIERNFSADLEAYEYNTGVSREACLSIMDTFLASSLVAEVNGKIAGLLAGQVTSLPSSGERVFQETLWLVEPSHRGKGMAMFHELERMCHSEGITMMVMGHMVNDNGKRLSRLYQQLGFVPLEIHYIKRLGVAQ